MKMRDLYTGLFAALIGLSLAAGTMTAPAMAAQAEKKAAATTKSQSAKKPAATCDGMDKASKAYSDCVKKQAQTTKEKKPAKTAKAATDKTKPATKTN